MKLPALALSMALAGPLCAGGDAPPPAADPYLWLEEVVGERPMAWVRSRNAETAAAFEEGPAFKGLESDLLRIMDSPAKIPYVGKHGDFYYNLWQDAANPRGLWRRTTLAEYRKAEPRWEVLLDLDALGKEEKESWVFKGATYLRPGNRRCLVSLSRGGSDAVVVREFDLGTKAFVKEGFQLPEAKSSVAWIDADTLFVGTEFGPGSMTRSGYPRLAKVWKRGTPLSEARTVFEGKEGDVSVFAFHDSTPGFERSFVGRNPTFFTSELHLLGKEGRLTKVDVPEDASASVHREWMLVQLRTPWKVGGRDFAAGSLLATRFEDFLGGGRDFQVLFEPTPATSLSDFVWTRDRLILNVLEDVKNRLTVLTPGKGAWARRPLKGAPALGSVSAWAEDDEASNVFFMTVTDFLTPTTLLRGEAGAAPERLKEAPSFFEAKGMRVSQHFATSKDGTRVPYFEVAPKDLKLDGSHPTLLTGYGGFEVSETPYYSGGVGRAWLGQGGVYAVANIRGGGEYGPRWHQAALRQNRHRAYEDFAAVAQDLVTRGVTSVKHLGIEGGSNGGLLMGNMVTLFPQCFGAVVCQVPLLDMQRYTKLLAGASWMEEYGDPDKPEDWAFLRTFSPYQNVRAGQPYPPVLFMTSTKDDRVHPGHARKMAAKMKDLGYPVHYWENVEGGHGGAADNRQAAHMWALAYTYLWHQLK